MKFAFALALALFALSLPASAEVAAGTATASLESPATPANTEPLSPIFLGPKPYCWNVEGTTCSPVGSTTGCTDACFNQLTCTCRSYVWLGQTIRYWDCQEVC